MSSEAWRVVLSTGEVREVEVREERDEGCPPVWSCGPEASSRSARDAVLLWVAREIELGRMEPTEILAPGGPTRADLVAERDALAEARDLARRERDEERARVEAARREGAEAMREALVRACQRRVEEHDETADAEDDEDAYARWKEASTITRIADALPLPGGVPT